MRGPDILWTLLRNSSRIQGRGYRMDLLPDNQPSLDDGNPTIGNYLSHAWNHVYMKENLASTPRETARHGSSRSLDNALRRPLRCPRALSSRALNSGVGDTHEDKKKVGASLRIPLGSYTFESSLFRR